MWRSSSSSLLLVTIILAFTILTKPGVGVVLQHAQGPPPGFNYEIPKRAPPVRPPIHHPRGSPPKKLPVIPDAPFRPPIHPPIPLPPRPPNRIPHGPVRPPPHV
ncbi:hypothetical protein RJT34_05264 [Clitoria ternatea]|uniref:Uncharacterized protein n=1 Tax=Clitoria ternatea TaxID=43366 RepID=A0AAN9K2X6_CLITE